MLFGGALSDRLSRRLVMLVSNLLRFLLVGTLAGLTYLDVVNLPSIFVIAFLFGLADAFLFPAASAMPPRLLEKEHLAAGNSLLQGTLQLTIVFGPMAGGLLLAYLGKQRGCLRRANDQSRGISTQTKQA